MLGFLVAAALTFGVFVVIGILYQTIGSAIDRRRFAPSTTFVRLPSGERLQAHVTGRGSPAVVLEAGISATSLSWTLVQPHIAEFTRVCSYDRLGLGRSDASARVVSASVHADTLRSLLRELQIPPPYVLVAHSYGTFIIRLFAARHPEEVAGLVLVDPIDAADWSRPSPAIERRLRRGVWFSRLGAALARIGFVRFVLSLLTGRAPGTAGRIAKMFGQDAAATLGGLLDEIRKLPIDIWPVVRACWCQPKCFHAMAAHLSGLPTSASEVAATSLADIPVTVVSAARGWTSHSGQHERLASRFPRGRLVVAEESGHWVMADAPDVIVAAIRELVEEITRTNPPIRASERTAG